MSKLEEEILVREIGKLGGFFGGFGARLAAKRLPVEEYETTIDIENQSTWSSRKNCSGFAECRKAD